MSDERIPALHQAIARAAVKTLFGERAVIVEMDEAPAGVPLTTHLRALEYGVRTFWNHWTGRHPHESVTRDEAQD